MGSAISTAIQVAETLKESVIHLHQSTKIGLADVASDVSARNEFVRSDRKRQTPYMFIHLSLDVIDSSVNNRDSQNREGNKRFGDAGSRGTNKRYGRGQKGYAPNTDSPRKNGDSSTQGTKSRRPRNNSDKVKRERKREDPPTSAPERDPKEKDQIESADDGQDAVTWKRGEKASGRNRRREIRAKVPSN